MAHISLTQFVNRFTSLLLDGRDLPRKQLARHILFVSALLDLDVARRYSERELNEELEAWSDRFGSNFGLDHVTLRRYLIDEGYLSRDSAGTQYWLETADLPYTFDDAIWQVELDQILAQARREREERKRQFLRKSEE